MNRKDFVSYDGKKLSLVVWDEVQQPKAIVQIIHGMSEHIARYDDFARMLNKHGFVVGGCDHRGHGHTAQTRDNIGIVEGDGHIFNQILYDQIDITKHLQLKYELPIIILGHSFGSFVAQRYWQEKQSGVLGYVFMGSGYQKGVQLKLAKMLAKSSKDRNKKGLIFAKMTFVKYNQKVGKDAPKNAWLTRDEAVVQAYNQDAFCSKVLSYGFYKSMFAGISDIYKKENMEKADKQVPILVTSGLEDGVGGYGKLCQKLLQFLQENGCNACGKFYEGARHEILNETNKQEVYEDILHFFNECVVS